MTSAEFAEVFPTCVGMNRVMRLLNVPTASVPHMRGDEPRLLTLGIEMNRCSPHAWG